MRLYMFKSDENTFSAFVADPEGSKLPKQLAPWTAEGFVENGAHPPHGLSRFRIENAIKHEGFQLWRQKETAKA